MGVHLSAEFYDTLRWQSDWNGYEVGYDDVLVVGLYYSPDLNASFYIDMETLQILEAWKEDE